jgi:hypothetical protein
MKKLLVLVVLTVLFALGTKALPAEATGVDGLPDSWPPVRIVQD